MFERLHCKGSAIIYNIFMSVQKVGREGPRGLALKNIDKFRIIRGYFSAFCHIFFFGGKSPLQ